MYDGGTDLLYEIRLKNYIDYDDVRLSIKNLTKLRMEHGAKLN